MLDLGLEHLDIDIGNANHAEVDAVVRTCGQSKMGFVPRVPFFFLILYSSLGAIGFRRSLPPRKGGRVSLCAQTCRRSVCLKLRARISADTV